MSNADIFIWGLISFSAALLAWFVCLVLRTALASVLYQLLIVNLTKGDSVHDAGADKGADK